MAKNMSKDNDPDKLLVKILIKARQLIGGLNPFFQDKVTIPYLKDIEGSTKQRIHNKGLDSNNQKIGIKSKRQGRYSPGYEKKKEKIQGKHFDGINLQLKGNLLKSYTVGTESGQPVLKFDPTPIYPTSAKFDGTPASLAAIHSANYNTEIYKPSEDQLEDAKAVLLKGVKIVLREGLSGI